MMLSRQSVLLLVAFSLSVCSSSAEFGAPAIGRTYLYRSSLTEVSQSDNSLSSVAARVFVTPHNFNVADSTDKRISSIHRLLCFLIEFSHRGIYSGERIKVVAEFEEDGMLSRLYLPLNKKIEVTEENLIKGLISLFVIRTNLEPGLETDSSGTCRVFYTNVNQTGSTSDITVIHKVRSACRRAHYPLDTWSYNLLSLSKLHGGQRTHTHYWLSPASGHIVRAVSYEEQTITTLSGTNVNEVKLLSSQELKLAENDWEPHGPQECGTVSEIDTMVKTHRMVHLAPIYPVTDSKNPCSLNDNLHPNRSLDISLTLLRSWIENSREDLHTHQLGHIKPLHHVMQLARILRCLPSTPDSVDLLSQASALAPPAIDSRMIYRQSGSWRDQLVDVLIVCGTPTCLSVVVKRLEALTEAANLNNANDRTLTREEQLTRAMLFDKVWPQLAQIQRPVVEQFEKMFTCCKSATIFQNRVVCLTTLANIWPRLPPGDCPVRAKLLDLVEAILVGNFSDSEALVTENTEEPETVNDKNSQFLAAVTIVEALNAVELLSPLLSLINSTDVYPSVKAAVIRVLGKLSYQHKTSDKQGLGYHIKLNEVQAVLNHMLFEEAEGNLVVDREIVQTLLLLNPYPDFVKQLFSALATQRRWPLVRECRLRLKLLCESHAFPSMSCTCFIGDDLCDLGAAGGWSGLAARSAAATHSSSFTRGELFNMNDTLVLKYLLQLTNGESEELCASKLSVDLLNPNGGGQLLQFTINANGLETFGDSLGLSTSPRAGSAAEGAWVNLELRYFDTSLPPWTIFYGGMTSLLKILWSASSEPAPMLQFLRSFVDERQYSAFSSGWILSLDTLGLLSVDLSAAMKFSIFSKSGRSLVRIRSAFVYEAYLHVVHQVASVSDSPRALLKGFGGEGELDFVTHVKVSDLPDGVCMAMNRGNDFQSLIWEGTRTMSDFRPVSTNTFSYRDLAQHSDYHILRNVNLPGVSFDLGKDNTEKCNKMGGTFLW